jgi:hypothetical protein
MSSPAFVFITAGTGWCSLSPLRERLGGISQKMLTGSDETASSSGAFTPRCRGWTID